MCSEVEPSDKYLKPQLLETITWLGENYEWANGVCLPRCVLYTHYLDFCKNGKYAPVGAATFGKIIRQRFPKLTTRRLGTRGQSKYHYYGIGIKKSSIYYHAIYTGKGLTRFSDAKVKKESHNRKYSLSSKSGTLLPDFPSANNLVIPETTTTEKVETFILMYRTHSQRILDAVIGGAVEEVQNLLLHFWQGMPEHLFETLNTPLISDVIALCDSILHQVLIDVLIPESISEIPESVETDMLHLAKYLTIWTTTALEDTTENIRRQKSVAVREFSKSLHRHRSFLQLAQLARLILLSQENVSAMSRDLSELDLTSLCSNVICGEDDAVETFTKVVGEFQDLLKKQAPVDAYVEWMDCVVHQCIIKEGQGDFLTCSSKFLMLEAHFTSVVMRDLTLKRAQSFASLHVVYQALQEYTLLAIETISVKSNQKRLQDNLSRHMKDNVALNMKPKFRTNAKRSFTCVDKPSPCTVNRGKRRKGVDESTDHVDCVMARSDYFKLTQSLNQRDSNDSPNTSKQEENRFPIAGYRGHSHIDFTPPSASPEWGRSSSFPIQSFGPAHLPPPAMNTYRYHSHGSSYGLDPGLNQQSRPRVTFNDCYANRYDDVRYQIPQPLISRDRFHDQYCDGRYGPAEMHHEYSTCHITGQPRGNHECNQHGYSHSYPYQTHPDRTAYF